MYGTYETYDANSARSYSVVGLIFVVLSALGGLISIVGVSWALSLTTRDFWVPWETQAIAGLAIAVLALLFLLNLVFVSLAYITYKRIEEGSYANARATALILGIFGLFPLFGAFIGGIFFLLTYWKLGKVLNSTPTPVYTTFPISDPVPAPAPVQTSTPVAEAKDRKYCVSCGQAISYQDRFCALCGIKIPQE